MSENMPRRAEADTVASLAAQIESGLQTRLTALGIAGRERSNATLNDAMLRLLVEVAAASTADDGLAVRALHEAFKLDQPPG